ncbi:MAG: hypothetical protein JO316_13800 [Abitibacteriaceae bacterium]|nr:hypothetical protein [Abditibacteriaceae bacterium]MBV9866422.1 hypothetical protein [Abditibacteriaceae bacterium]
MEENGTQAILIGCCLIVTNIVLAAFGGVITLLVIVTTTGITLFTADEPGALASGHKMHANNSGLMAECVSLVLVFIISATINWLLCISLLKDRQAARKYALSVSLLPTIMAGVIGILILAHYTL